MRSQNQNKINTVVVCMIMVLLLGSDPAFSQVTQTVKGRVIDQQSKIELIGASVLIEGTLMGAATDVDGYFRIPNVPLGRHAIKVSYLGYKLLVIPEVLVSSAKEVVLTIELEEEFIAGNEIVVTSGIEKGTAQNPLSTVSARAFTVEETQRYAGGFDDPARLASSFAGVTYGNAQDNAIIIRGNAPSGLLWRLEGIEIPNPNHFPGGNVLGGGLFTIFSSNLLANSDFFTGAFPAEYGNATSGVFDMRFRNGNSDVREYTFQAGLMGIDFSTEGPINRGSNASYLVNYRYSTLGLLTDLNAIDTDQEIRYQDLSFKVNVPTKKAGTFSLWGVGALDRLFQPAVSDSALWTENFDRMKFSGDFTTAAAGLNHKLVLNASTYINSTVAVTTQKTLYDQDRLDDGLMFQDNEYADAVNSKITLTSTINHKFSSRLMTTSGFIVDQLLYNMDFKAAMDNDASTYQTYVDESGSSQLFHIYSQAKYALSPSLDVNIGVRYQYFALNSNASVEPRAGLSWQIAPRHEASLGYGRHSKLEDLQCYMAVQPNTPGSILINKDLDFTKTDHYVFSYSYQLTPNTRIKIEPYYQTLFDVPVIADSSFSMVNLKDERYINDKLVNEGTGTNYGVDLTLEKFLSNNYYYMISGSLFESKYKGGDGVERDTRYNRNYVLNVLGGREFKVKTNNILSLNVRFTLMGAERTSPLLLQRSLTEKQVYLDETRAFENSLTASKYLDFTLNYRMNHRKASHVLSLMIKNVLGSENDYGYIYSYEKDSVIRSKEAIVLPNISYRVEF